MYPFASQAFRLEPLARLLGEDRRDFDRDEGVFVQVAQSGLLKARKPASPNGTANQRR